MTGAPEPTLAVVVPAHRAGAEIGPCLDALFAAGFAAEDVLVVDDGCPEGSGDRAAARGVGVIRNEAPLRPARARNRGVDEVDADIVVFVDADVLVHADARARIVGHFTADPGLAAVFGSYDDAPPAPALVSRYRNLLHHFVHQRSAPEAETFWTGFGAVRRAAFLQAGGLDRAWENIEDVEFGLRLRAAGGRIRLDRDMQATHLKAWTPVSMFKTDLYGRALPWTRLLMRGRAGLGDLNTAREHRISAAAVAVFPAALAASFAAPAALWLAALAALVFLAANRRFLGFLVRTKGPAFALGAIPFHAAHYVAALLGYGLARWEAATGRTRGQT